MFIAVIALSNSLLSQENRFTDSAFTNLNNLNEDNELGSSVYRVDANNFFKDKYFNQPPPNCSFVPDPAKEFEIKFEYKTSRDVPTYITPIVGDINNDDIIEIISMGMKGFFPHGSSTSGERSGNILIFDGRSGQLIREIETPLMAFQGPTPIVIGDITMDGNAEIIISTMDHAENLPEERGILICYNHEGKELWRSNTQVGVYSPLRYGGVPALADFNQDGKPEVYIYNEIFNAQTGQKLIDGGPNGIGLMGTHILGAVSTTVAADFTDHPGLELAAGNTLYEVTINNLNGTAGNSMFSKKANFTLNGSPSQDGYTAVVDLDLDGKLDIVVTSGRKNTASLIERTVYAWNPRNGNLIAYATLPQEGGTALHTSLAFIGDVNGDGKPNIGVCTPFKVDMFAYDGTTQLKKLWDLNTTDLSGQTKLTMFDFNQDGVQEIVYRDETKLMIINGSGDTPIILKDIPSFSHTGAEGPVIADVNNDGSAQILVTSNTSGQPDVPIGRIEFFSSGLQPWAPARRVWNQYAYFNVNVNDDLSIPIFQPTHSEAFFNDPSRCPVSFQKRPLNNFLVQSTYYDANGCQAFPLPDATIELDDDFSLCTPSNPLIITFKIKNGSSDSEIPSGLPISIYDGDPFDKGILIGSTHLTKNVAANGVSEVVSISLDPSEVNQKLYIVANTPQNIKETSSSKDFLECDYLNNIEVLTLSFTEPNAPEGPIEQNFCDGSRIENLQTNGENIKWYDADIEGKLLSPNSILVDGQTYFASQTIENCESSGRLEVKVNLEKTPTPDGPTEQPFCTVNKVKDLIINGSNIKWYLSETGKDLVGSEEIVSDGQTYFASQTIEGCESFNRHPVMVIGVDPPFGNSVQEFCELGKISDLFVDGIDIKWFDSPESEIPLSSEENLSDSEIYYASQTVGGCESTDRLAVLVSQVQIEDPIAEPIQKFCNSTESTLSSIIVAGTDLVWYDREAGGEILPANQILLNGETYFVVSKSQTADCEGKRFSVQVFLEVCDLEVFNALSLKSNNKNDYLKIRNIEFFPDNKLEIYNRYGKKVYGIENYGTAENLFYGESNVEGVVKRESKLPTGSYLYKLTYFHSIDSQYKTLTGTLFIINDIK